jgi:hypothetical protein
MPRTLLFGKSYIALDERYVGPDTTGEGVDFARGLMQA